MTHEVLPNFNKPDVFFTSLTLRFKSPSVRHRLWWNTENLILEKGQESAQLSQGQIVIFTRELLKHKKFVPIHLFAIKTVGPGELATEILGVSPAAKLLLQVSGHTKIKRTLQFFEKLQKKQVDFKKIPECVWTGIHSRNEVNHSLDLMAQRVIDEQKIFSR